MFGQAANVDRLLQMLRQMDPAKDNLADNEEIQVSRRRFLRGDNSHGRRARNCIGLV